MLAENERERRGYLIVAVGASAGGLEALKALFGGLKPGCGMAFVVVTHQHTERENLLPGLLDASTELTVEEIKEGVRPVPDHIYVTGPLGDVKMSGGTLSQGTDAEAGASHRIDHFLRSLALDQGSRAVAVILSGAGSDGTLGIKEIKAAGGIVMAQDPEDAKYASMPASAICSGMVDVIKPAHELSSELSVYADKAPERLHSLAEAAPLLPSESIRKILQTLRRHTGHDFCGYKQSTMSRRIERRMQIHRIERPGAYATYLRDRPEEAQALLQELLISVTSFFRDREAWDTLREKVLPKILVERHDQDVVRIWVPGCATGEEAYSVAILLHEARRALEAPPTVQVFATDLDATAIETARRGVYPEGIAADVPSCYLEKYFSQEDASYRIRSDVRAMLTFATQNILSDPPFTRMDLVICRNLLIYLDGKSQEALVPTFHYALRPGAFLFLGSSENLTTLDDYFDILDKKYKILQRQDNVQDLRLQLPSAPAFTSPVTPRAPAPVGKAIPGLSESKLQQALLRRFAPASVVVNQDDEIVYFSGRTGAYLEPAEGEPKSELFAMLREGLAEALRPALRQVRTELREHHVPRVRMQTEQASLTLDLHLAPLIEAEAVQGLLVAISFIPQAGEEEREAAPVAGEAVSGEASNAEKQQLEVELARTRESLQATIEELQTSNEELKSSNEELQSTNEELQSTNEELQTSKEELESMNEELNTVNSEQGARMEALGRANDDMKNLLNSIRVGTIFLDEDLKVKRYTEEAQSTFRLIESDIGRPLSDLSTSLKYEGLIEQCRHVLNTLETREAEVGDSEGRWYLLRIMPYRTSENVIDGVVITLSNITRAKQAETVANAAKDFFVSIVETMRHPLLVLDANLRVQEANQAFCATFGIDCDAARGRLIYDLAQRQWDLPELRELLECILPEKTMMQDYRMHAAFTDSQAHELLLNASRLVQADGLPDLILLSIEDATGKEAQ